MNGQEYLDLLKTRYSVRSFFRRAVDRRGARCAASGGAAFSHGEELAAIPSLRGAKRRRPCEDRRGDALPLRRAHGDIGAYDASVSAKGLGYETGDFGDIDTSIVLTNIANAAAAENLGSCWVGAYDSAIIRKNFNIPNNYVLVDLMMVGHSAEDAEPSPRHEQTEPLDTLVVRETF